MQVLYTVMVKKHRERKCVKVKNKRELERQRDRPLVLCVGHKSDETKIQRAYLDIWTHLLRINPTLWIESFGRQSVSTDSVRKYEIRLFAKSFITI